MNWIGNFFFCVGTMSLTGSIALVAVLLMRKALDWFGFGLRLGLMKLITVLYLVPIVYPLMRLSRYHYSQGNWVYEGLFGVEISGIVAQCFQLIGVIWLIGMGTGIIVRSFDYMRLQNFLKHNKPLTQISWISLVSENHWIATLDGIELCQNEFVHGPIVTGLLRPVIVLPICNYTDKQMCMVLEHEIRHVRNHDLWWKRIVLLVTWLHWFNPLVYLLLNSMVVEQEVECDVSSCQNTSHFTAKEYAQFLLSLGGLPHHRLFEATLFESKSSLIRRIEEMKNRGKDGKVDHRKLIIVGAILMVIALNIAYLVSEVIADYEENWIYGTESGTKEEENGWSDGEEIRGEQDDSPEEDIAVEQLSYSSMMTIDFAAKGNTRYLYQNQYYQAGDTVLIFAGNSDDTALFRVGLKNMNSGELIYVEGCQTLIHTFFINNAGDYRVFVQNCSDRAVTVGGCIYREMKADKEQTTQIKQEHKLSQLTMDALTTELDIRYTNLRGYSEVEETRVFQVYWDVSQEKYVVVMDGSNGKVSEIVTVRAEDKVGLLDAQDQIEKGKYAAGGKLVLLHEGRFVMEATTEDKEELLRYIGGYIMRSISGVGVEKSGEKMYEMKAFLSAFTGRSKNTEVDVYYSCGYCDTLNQLYWDEMYDVHSKLYSDNTIIFEENVTENKFDLSAWLEIFTEIQTCELFLKGTLEERLISADNDVVVDWGPMLHAMWTLWIDGKDTVEGTVKGEIYLSEILGAGTDNPIYKGWICLDQEEPIKVSARDSRELAKTINIDENAVFSEEVKDTALIKLTFDMTIGRQYQ